MRDRHRRESGQKLFFHPTQPVPTNQPQSKPGADDMGMGGTFVTIEPPDRIVHRELFDEDWTGGETTVTVKQKGGRGGRATEFLLGCTIALQGERGVYVLAADTDGIDGMEANAGAIVTPSTPVRARQAGLKAQEFLDRNDAYSFFHRLGDLVVPGPTFTNVNDFRALLIG